LVGSGSGTGTGMPRQVSTPYQVMEGCDSLRSMTAFAAHVAELESFNECCTRLLLKETHELVASRGFYS
jgi:hypothetical protein